MNYRIAPFSVNCFTDYYQYNKGFFWTKEVIETAYNSGEEIEKVYYLATLKGDVIDDILTFGSRLHCLTEAKKLRDSQEPQTNTDNDGFESVEVTL